MPKHSTAHPAEAGGQGVGRERAPRVTERGGQPGDLVDMEWLEEPVAGESSEWAREVRPGTGARRGISRGC